MFHHQDVRFKLIQVLHFQETTQSPATVNFLTRGQCGSYRRLHVM